MEEGVGGGLEGVDFVGLHQDEGEVCGCVLRVVREKHGVGFFGGVEFSYNVVVVAARDEAGGVGDGEEVARLP